MLSCEFCKIFKNIFFNRTPPMGASESWQMNIKMPINWWWIFYKMIIKTYLIMEKLVFIARKYQSKCAIETLQGYIKNNLFQRVFQSFSMRFSRLKLRKNLSLPEKVCLNWTDFVIRVNSMSFKNPVKKARQIDALFFKLMKKDWKVRMKVTISNFLFFSKTS